MEFRARGAEILNVPRKLLFDLVNSSMKYSITLSSPLNYNGKINLISEVLMYKKIIETVAREPNKYGIILFDNPNVSKHVQIALQLDKLLDHQDLIFSELYSSMTDVNKLTEGIKLATETDLGALDPCLLKI